MYVTSNMRKRTIELSWRFVQITANKGSFPKHLCKLGEWRMILEIEQQKFGQILIIQSRDMIFQRFDSFRVCHPLRWYSSNICDVTTVQLSNNGTAHKFLQNFTFHENVSSLFFYT